MDQENYYNHSTSLYNLYLSYKPDTLKINLKVHSNEGIWFQTIISNSSMTEELRNHFETIQNVFQCLKDINSFEINTKTGEIRLVTYFLFKNKKIQKKSIIQLKPTTIDEVEALQLEVSSLKHEVQDLRRYNEKSTPSKKIQN